MPNLTIHLVAVVKRLQKGDAVADVLIGHDGRNGKGGSLGKNPSPPLKTALKWPL